YLTIRQLRDQFFHRIHIHPSSCSPEFTTKNSFQITITILIKNSHPHTPFYKTQNLYSIICRKLLYSFSHELFSPIRLSLKLRNFYRLDQFPEKMTQKNKLC